MMRWQNIQLASSTEYHLQHYSWLMGKWWLQEVEQEDHWVVVGTGLAAVTAVELLQLEVVATWIAQWSVLAMQQGFYNFLFSYICLVQSHMINAVLGLDSYIMPLDSDINLAMYNLNKYPCPHRIWIYCPRLVSPWHGLKATNHPSHRKLVWKGEFLRRWWDLRWYGGVGIGFVVLTNSAFIGIFLDELSEAWQPIACWE